MADPATATPYRHLARLQSEFHLESLAALLRVVPDHFVRAMVFQSIARVCVGDWTSIGGIAPSEQPGAATTARALASSLHRPFETVRRQVDRLIACGLCVRRGHRVFLDPCAPQLRDYYLDMHDAFLRLVGRIAVFGIPLPPPPSKAHPIATVIRSALDLSLEPLDTFRASGRDWNEILLWMAVSAIEVRHITHDDALSRRFAIAYTPDHLRRPVNLRSVATLLCMPYASAWRRARALEGAGLMSCHPGGWLVAGAHLRDPRIEHTLILHAHRLLFRVRATILDGLDPKGIDAKYQDADPGTLRRIRPNTHSG